MKCLSLTCALAALALGACGGDNTSSNVEVPGVDVTAKTGHP